MCQQDCMDRGLNEKESDQDTRRRVEEMGEALACSNSDTKKSH